MSAQGLYKVSRIIFSNCFGVWEPWKTSNSQNLLNFRFEIDDGNLKRERFAPMKNPMVGIKVLMN